jgi:hypothetical protein
VGEPLSEAELQALADKVNALPPPQRLRLAADLMERKRSSTALLIIRRVAYEVELALLLAGGPRG